MTEDSIQLFSEQIDFTYSEPGPLVNWIRSVISQENHEIGFVNIIFCSDEYLRDLNDKYLNHSYFTDILTFQYERLPVEGDLYISIERVRENATNLNVKFIHELKRVIIHGILHLVGYSDHSAKEIEIMRTKENFYLKQTKNFN